MDTPNGGVPPWDLLRLAFGAQAAQVVYVAAKLGLADLLKDGSSATADLAAASDVDATALRRLLRGLVSLGVCTELAGDRFALTAMGEYLRADRPDSVQSRVILNTELLQPLWGELLHTVRTGESEAARVLGMPMWEYLGARPETGALLDRTMASYARYRVGPAVATYDFGQFGTIVDVGGANGALLIEILRTYPRQGAARRAGDDGWWRTVQSLPVLGYHHHRPDDAVHRRRERVAGAHCRGAPDPAGSKRPHTDSDHSDLLLCQPDRGSAGLSEMCLSLTRQRTCDTHQGHRLAAILTLCGPTPGGKCGQCLWWHAVCLRLRDDECRCVRLTRSRRSGG